jgi:flagellar protein FlaD
MAGFSDKIKKITSVLTKKDKKKGTDSPFESDAPSFLQGTPDLGSVPDLSAGLPPTPPGVQNTPGISGNPSFPPGMAPPGGLAQQSPPQSSVNDELVEENRKKIKDVESKISKSDVTLNIVKRENEDIKKTVDKIDQSVLELLSLYEIVSNQVNPFVGDDVATRTTIERFEKTENRITEMGDMLVQMKIDFDVAYQ